MRALAPILVLALAACATTPPEESGGSAPRTVRIVDGSGNVTQLSTRSDMLANATLVEVEVARAWRALVGAYRELGIPVSEINSDERMLGANVRTRGRLGNARLSAYLDCGRTQGGPSADTYDVHMVVETRVLEGELNTSRVATLIEATARPSGFATGPVRCSTTGTLERRIVEQIRDLAYAEVEENATR